MLIKTIRLRNLLSFGPESDPIELGPLNVIIGPNGTGKSNLLEGISLLQSAPRVLSVPVREGGGIKDWLWKGATQTPDASIEVTVEKSPLGNMDLAYRLQFTEQSQRLHLVDERIENERPYPGHDRAYFYYAYERGRPVLNISTGKRELRREDVDPELSILSQRKDPDQYPEITYLGEVFSKIRQYREWSFGRYTAPRLPQKSDLPNDFLEEDARNLGLVLNRLRRDTASKKSLIERLRLLYEGIEDFDVQIEGGTVQVFLSEGRFTVPATRLSDGTLRYLAMLAVLCHPTPPPLVCIEEPENGLHPDIVSELAKLLSEASAQTQLIVTTHSDLLVDALSDTPEVILVAEKTRDGTAMKRLSRDSLSAWLEKYSLGELWRSGQIGGNRW